MDRTMILREQLLTAQAEGITFTAISGQTGVSRTAISQFVNKGLMLKPEQMAAIEETLQGTVSMQGQTTATGEVVMSTIGPKAYKTEIELYQTEEYREAIGWCKYIFAKRRMGVMIGFPGSGKTTILREFCKITPEAHYIECWPSMRMGDLLAALASAIGVSLRGNSYNKAQQIMRALRARSDVMFVFDESEYLRKWDVDKFEVLRKIWDNTQTPILFAGTPELENVLTRGGGRANLSQLYRRKYEIKLNGIRAEEVRGILSDYNIAPDAAEMLVKIAVDAEHGGMGNFVELLDMALETAAGDVIDAGIVGGAKRYKLLF